MYTKSILNLNDYIIQDSQSQELQHQQHISQLQQKEKQAEQLKRLRMEIIRANHLKEKAQSQLADIELNLPDLQNEVVKERSYLSEAEQINRATQKEFQAEIKQLQRQVKDLEKDREDQKKEARVLQKQQQDLKRQLQQTILFQSQPKKPQKQNERYY